MYMYMQEAIFEAIAFGVKPESISMTAIIHVAEETCLNLKLAYKYVYTGLHVQQAYEAIYRSITKPQL